MKNRKPYTHMNANELAEATKEFDREMIRDKGKPLSPRKRARLREALADLRAKRGVGRPRVGQGAKRVLVTVEQRLLEQADTFAKRQKITRAQLIAEGLRLVMKRAG